MQAAAGRVKVMPGTGSNSTAEATRLTRWAAKEGADAALMVAPYYNKPTQQGFYEHYKVVAEAVDIPICVYNIPGRTGKNIDALREAVGRAVATSRQWRMPAVGENAPAFALYGVDGKRYALEDYVGKSAVVLAWFPKAFTPG